MPRARNTGNTSISQADLVKLAKKGHNHTSAAKELGVAVGSFSPLQWSEAMVTAGEWDEIKGTESNVKRLRREGARWERIAAQTGLSVKEVKELAPEEPRGTKSENGDDDDTPTRGRGRGRTSKKTTAASSKKESTSTTPKRTSKKSAAASAATPRRSRTRAARRAAQSGNPS